MEDYDYLQKASQETRSNSRPFATPTDSFNLSRYESTRLVSKLSGHKNYSPSDICRAITGSYMDPKVADAAEILISALKTSHMSNNTRMTITRLSKLKPELADREKTDPKSAAMALLRCFCDRYDTVSYEDFIDSLRTLMD